ncbi:putative metalloprotease CJM1_0395 family protein [Hydrogenimonas sp.]
MQIGSSVTMRVDYLQTRGGGRSDDTGTPKDRNVSSERAEKGEKREKGKDPAQKAAEDRQIAQLQARDTQVRAHEAAHLAAAGGIAAGGASFTYQKGPDGKMYAIGGEVPLSIPKSDDPKEAIAKMRQVAAAAMAPADPSPQDYAVAANARSEEMKALQELRKEQIQMRRKSGLEAYGQESAAESGKNASGSEGIDTAA